MKTVDKVLAVVRSRDTMTKQHAYSEWPSLPRSVHLTFLLNLVAAKRAAVQRNELKQRERKKRKTQRQIEI